MEATNLVRDIGSLPPEAQKQVSDFVAFLKHALSGYTIGSEGETHQLADEPFIGMWQGS